MTRQRGLKAGSAKAERISIEQGNALMQLGCHVEALECYLTVLKRQPKHLAALLGCGIAHFHLADLDLAWSLFERVIKVSRFVPEAYYGCAYICFRRREWSQARALVCKAIALKPMSHEFHHLLGVIALTVGDFETGWPEYEWRWQSPQKRTANARFQASQWDGKEPLQGKSILLHCEDGLGDLIQFCRYVPMVASRAAHVLLEVPDRLLVLMQGMEAELIRRGDPLPPCDYHSSLMSLPLAFSTTLHSIPAEVPYLRADPAKSEVWRDRLMRSTRRRIGLVWSPGVKPLQPKSGFFADTRGISLTKLASLCDLEVDYYSLQLDAPDSPGVELFSRVFDLGPQQRDMSDAAAIIENLDLVLTVDTSIAHLAAALGKATWILTCFEACWRWLDSRLDSPWYPTVKLYRQPAPGDWDSVLHAVRIDLEEFKRCAT